MKFRRHHGGLAESMDTVQEVETMKDLIRILRTTFPSFFKPEDSKVEVAFYTYDSRIDWNTYIVTIDGKAVGFTDGPLE